MGELHHCAPRDRAAGGPPEGSGGMSSFERLGDSAAARKVFARVAETAQDGVPTIKPVVPLAEVLETIDLSGVRARPIDWLWRGYIPLRKVTILSLIHI